MPPYSAVQCIPGVRHTRGTPPAVVELADGVSEAELRAMINQARAMKDARKGLPKGLREQGEEAVDLVGLDPPPDAIIGFHDQHVEAGLRDVVGGGEPGDSGAHDDHIRAVVQRTFGP